MKASTNIHAMLWRGTERKMLLAVLAALLVSVFVLLAAVKPSQAIVGGTEVKPVGKYPFMVALLWNWKFGQPPNKYLYCSGTLIDNNSVLTAGHCLENDQGTALMPAADLEAGKLDVIVGATELGVGQGEVRDAIGVAVHPNYNPKKGSTTTLKPYDVGVITLNQPVPNPKTINLATLSEDYLEKPGRKVTAAGWGFSSDVGKPVASRWLREVQEEIRGGLHEPKLYITAGALGRRGGVCHGDSGGPLFDKDNQGRYTQIGVTSGGYPWHKCADPLTPDVFAEVNNPSIRTFITNAALKNPTGVVHGGG